MLMCCVRQVPVWKDRPGAAVWAGPCAAAHQLPGPCPHLRPDLRHQAQVRPTRPPPHLLNPLPHRSATNFSASGYKSNEYFFNFLPLLGYYRYLSLEKVYVQWLVYTHGRRTGADPGLFSVFLHYLINNNKVFFWNIGFCPDIYSNMIKCDGV
jgi:hypothetical protein